MRLETGRKAVLVTKWQKGPDLGNCLVQLPALTIEGMKIKEREKATKMFWAPMWGPPRPNDPTEFSQTSLLRLNYHPHFTDEEVEAQKLKN